MGLYKFKDKGPAYGLAYTEGEIAVIDEEKGIETLALVPEVTKDNKGNVVNTGRQVWAKKHYTVDYLIDSNVIGPCNAEDRKKFEAKQDINSKADKAAEKNAREEAALKESKIERMKK